MLREYMDNARIFSIFAGSQKKFAVCSVWSKLVRWVKPRLYGRFFPRDFLKSSTVVAIIEYFLTSQQNYPPCSHHTLLTILKSREQKIAPCIASAQSLQHGTGQQRNFVSVLFLHCQNICSNVIAQKFSCMDKTVSWWMKFRYKQETLVDRGLQLAQVLAGSAAT